MPLKQHNQKAEKYDERERKLALAIKTLEENPDVKISHVADQFQLNRKTPTKRYYGRTIEARKAHPERAALTEEEGGIEIVK